MMRLLRYGLFVFGVLLFGCAGASGGETRPSATSTPTGVPIAPTALVGEPQRSLEEAIRRGDWARAEAIVRGVGDARTSVDLMNRAMREGLRLAQAAQQAGDPAGARAHAAGVLSLIRDVCRCTDAEGRLRMEAIPAGFEVERYVALSLLHEYAGRGGPLPEWAVDGLVSRFSLDRGQIWDFNTYFCPVADRLFAVVGFQIVDLMESVRVDPPLDPLREEERNPRMFQVSCTERGIEWLYTGALGRAIRLEAAWDGQGFRVADFAREDLGAGTHETVRQHVMAGELEEALAAYENSAFTGDVDQDPELATLALRQGLAVARRRSEAGDITGALRALHAAFRLAAFPYGLEDETFLPEDWATRPRSLREWQAEAFYGPSLDPLLYRDALTEYGALLVQGGRASEAEPILRGLTVLDPEHALAYLYLGDALWDQGKAEEARRFYQRYRELTPGGPWPDRVRERAP